MSMNFVIYPLPLPASPFINDSFGSRIKRNGRDPPWKLDLHRILFFHRDSFGSRMRGMEGDPAVNKLLKEIDHQIKAGLCLVRLRLLVVVVWYRIILGLLPIILYVLKHRTFLYYK